MTSKNDDLMYLQATYNSGSSSRKQRSTAVFVVILLIGCSRYMSANESQGSVEFIGEKKDRKCTK